MQAVPCCPICENLSLESVRAYQYLPVADEKIRQGDFADYLALRRRVLFEVWFKGSERVELCSAMCSRCGFMTFLPRPDAQDVEAKYRFLQAHEKSIGGQSSNLIAAQWDRRRSERIYRAVIRRLSRRSNGTRVRVLDLGGGDGKLLSSFVQRGYECCLVDYNLQPRAGIQKLGDTLDDLGKDEFFDVALSSHVLEHVADPASMIDQIAKRLHDRGILYAEVPFEIWRGIPIDWDPVTHVNFFNLYNFMRLCQRSGLGIVDAYRKMSTYDAGRLEVLVVVAQKHHPETKISFGACLAETRRWLYPSHWTSAERLLRLRRFPTLVGIRRRLTHRVS
jgi:SAM-dependent methyltransferase